MTSVANNVGPAKLDIAYERFGSETAPSVLLIMGVGAQMLGWPDAFCELLVGHGLHVIRFDNRDVGLSTHLTSAPMPDLLAALRGDHSSASYTLPDMAADAAGLLDALGLASVHVVGASMGGFIAQELAIGHPGRVRSLTSIMSSTGDLSVGQPAPEALALFSKPFVRTRAEVVQRAIENSLVIGSPGFPRDDEGLADRVGRSYDRAFDPLGLLRQSVGVIASKDRTPQLRELTIPALVIHGTEDRLVTLSGGEATAAAIPGAELMVIEGMGHDLPRAAWTQITDAIAALIRRAS